MFTSISKVVPKATNKRKNEAKDDCPPKKGIGPSVGYQRRKSPPPPPPLIKVLARV